MFYPDALGPFFEERPDVAWVPQLTCHTQVLATTHERIGFAAFSGGGDPFW